MSDPTGSTPNINSFQETPFQNDPVTPPVAVQTTPPVPVEGNTATTPTPPPAPVAPSSSFDPSGVITGDFSEPPRKKSGIIPLILGIMFLLLLAGLSAGAYAVAYEKITLPEKYAEKQLIVSHVVMSLPFMPKTPGFLLEKSLMVQKDIKKESYDLSVAVESESFTSVPGMSSLDLQAKGLVDYSDEKDIKLSVNAFVTKDMNFEVLKPDKFLYFRINKVPSLWFSLIGIKEETLKPVMGNWYSYDTTPLDSEARKEIQGDSEVPSQKYIGKNLNQYLDDKILEKIIVSEGKVDDYSVYKLNLNADKDLIDYIGRKIDLASEKKPVKVLGYASASAPEKLSDVVKTMSWEIDIDKKEYYIRKAVLRTLLAVDDTGGYSSMFLGPGTNPTKEAEIDLVFAAKFSDFGKDVKIEAPNDAKTWTDFTDAISEIMMSQYNINYSEQVGKANDARRKSDMAMLRNGLELYMSDCSKYPTDLQSLTEKGETQNCPVKTGSAGNYLAKVPVDPDGSNYYYKVSAGGKTYDLCANLETPDADKNTCPDKNFNYHLTNP